jgi:hypothetical protein
MIIVWALCNTLPYLDSSIGKLLAPKQIPSDYVVFKNLIDSEDSDFRVLAVPKTSRWMNNSINNPDVNIADLTGDTWASFTDASNTNPQATMLSALNQPFSNKLLDMSSVKYLVVPILDTANDDNFFIYFGGDRQIFVDALSKVRFLKRIDSGTQELAVFENADYRPHVYTTATMESASTTVPYKEVSYTMLEPTQYKVTLTNLSRPTQVNFSENFHPDWKVRVGYFDWWSAIWNRHYFMPDEFHYENNAKLNSFMVDPSYIKQNFSPGSYSQNSDGSINVEITIYFKPQSYLYLGLLISAATFILCLACLGYWVIKRRSKLSIIKHENT